MSRDLETALQENDLLRDRVLTLERWVESKDQQLFELGCSGGGSTTGSGKQCPAAAVWIDSPDGSPRNSRHKGASVNSTSSGSSFFLDTTNSNHDATTVDSTVAAVDTSGMNSSSSATSGVTAMVTGVMGIAPVSIAVMIFGNGNNKNSPICTASRSPSADIEDRVCTSECSKNSTCYDMNNDDKTINDLTTSTEPATSAEEY